MKKWRPTESAAITDERTDGTKWHLPGAALKAGKFEKWKTARGGAAAAAAGREELLKSRRVKAPSCYVLKTRRVLKH